jgi:hypothetical protein
MPNSEVVGQICDELHALAGSEFPPLHRDDATYGALVGIWRMGLLLWAAIAASRLDSAVSPIAEYLEAAANPKGAELVWRARADVQWLFDLPDEPAPLALWARNWFVRAGLTVPDRSERVLFANWWRRVGKTLRDSVLSKTAACRAAGALGSGDPIPHDCDFELARHEISQLWRLAEQDASRHGGHYYVLPSVISAWEAYAKSPTLSTARELYSAMPTVGAYFVACAPGGWAYEMHRTEWRVKFCEAAATED